MNPSPVVLAIIALGFLCAVFMLAAFVLALCKAAAGGDIQITREYECEITARRSVRRRECERQLVR